jgi:ribosomal protein S18 acetylase RimI-like enzyme
MSVTIRKCTEVDIPAVQALQRLWYGENNTFGFVPGDETYLTGKVSTYFFLAVSDEEQFLGFAYGTVHVSKELAIFADGTAYIEIDDIYIHPEYRDRGIGGELLDAILKAAAENGIERSLVYSASKDMDKSIGFYRAHGYQTWFVQMFK